MIAVRPQQTSRSTQTMPDHSAGPVRLEEVVSTVEEFDRVVAQSLPALLERAALYTKRFLRETGQWSEDVAHEKFVLRWGAEYLEQFLVVGRTEVPCRPLFLLDSLVARQHSRPEPFCYHPDLMTPLGRMLDGLIGRASISRDALIALYYHCYGLGPGQVIALVGLNGSESQRIYKNCRRWRESGWQRTMDDTGLTARDVQELCDQQLRHRQRFNGDAERLIRFAQAHYRKSEPEHYPCLARHQWAEMYGEGYGVEYRLWHLAQCLDCLVTVWDLGHGAAGGVEKPRVTLQLKP